MATINLEEYAWGKIYTNSNLATGIFSFLFAFILILRGNTVAYILFILFLALSIFSFLQYYFFKKNKIYIQISDDEITIFPKLFMGNTKIYQWEDITKIENSSGNIVILHLIKGNITKINLGVLNKNTRESLVQSINKKINKY